MKRNRIVATTVASTITLALALSACGDGGTGDASSPTPDDTGSPAEGATITLWLAGGDTNADLRQYLIDTFAEENPGSTLVIEEQAWGDLIPALTTALPDANNTPDVVEIGNTQAPTFTTVGAFREISPELFEELGGDSLIPSFVEAGSVGDTVYALPYYFGSRYMFYRKDLWSAAGLEVPTTLAEFGESVAKLRTDTTSGLAMGGQDWRNGISWVFSHGGELATFDGSEWTSTWSDPNTIEGLKAWQQVFQTASNNAPTDRDLAYWEFINDGPDGEAPAAATVMAPGWARGSIGDLNDDDERVWNDEVFDVFALPGVDGGVAPGLLGGSNIAISAQSQNPELAENLLRIIFSEEYQTMLGEAGLGPANSDYTSALGDDKFAEIAIATAQASKLTPASAGWAAIEGQQILETFFQDIAEGGDVEALAAALDEQLTPILNGQ